MGDNDKLVVTKLTCYQWYNLKTLRIDLIQTCVTV